ncbi:hypothetical protein B0H10DRAFT_2187675 [Mycena sp. CBHHK59/15]|nr:hypothetical protein B0H10DRAFT_2187675 [Mycena sp. CBHHK59/15]
MDLYFPQILVAFNSSRRIYSHVIIFYARFPTPPVTLRCFVFAVRHPHAVWFYALLPSTAIGEHEIGWPRIRLASSGLHPKTPTCISRYLCAMYHAAVALFHEPVRIHCAVPVDFLSSDLVAATASFQRPSRPQIACFGQILIHIYLLNVRSSLRRSSPRPGDTNAVIGPANAALGLRCRLFLHQRPHVGTSSVQPAKSGDLEWTQPASCCGRISPTTAADPSLWIFVVFISFSCATFVRFATTMA